MISEDSLQLETMLNHILNANRGILHVALIDRTGFLIRSVSRKNKENPAFIDKLGIIGNAMFQTAEEQELCHDFGEISIQVTEYQHAFIFSSNIAASAILIIAAEKHLVTNIGMLYHLTKKYQHQIDKVLKDFVQVDPRSIPEDVRAMFADFNNLN